MAVVTIDELDPASLDEATLAQLAELATIEERAFAPDDPPVEVAEVADELRVLPTFEERLLWVARDPDGRLLGRATLDIEHREENQHLAEVSLVARAPERAAGYSLVAWDGRCPDELLEPFAGIMAVMNTAPRGDMDMEDEFYTPELIRDFEASIERKGTNVWTIAARHDATGQLAGYTALFFPKHRPWQAEQGDTGVDPAHRDRGLGRWLKAVNLLRLLDERPEAQVVDTGNAATNEPMLNINVALGFRPLVEVAILQRKLT